MLDTQKLQYKILACCIALSLFIANPCFAQTKPKAKNVIAETTNFDKNLSSSDDTVQKALDTLDELTSGSGINGTVFITDITPQNPLENVGSKTFSSDGVVLDSCLSSTEDIEVDILALPGHTSWNPYVTVEGNVVSLTEDADRPLFTGSINLSTGGDTEINAIHQDGAIHACTVSYEVKPQINSAIFTGGYSGSQTELKENDTFQLRVQTDVDIVRVEISDYEACKASNYDFSATDDVTITVTIDDEGDTATLRPARVRVRKSTGTYSDWYITSTAGSVDGINVVNCNNLYPSISINSIVYPATQEALKDSETGTVNNTVSDFDTISYTSPNSHLSITNDSTYESAKTVQRINGDYNISINNFRVEANRAANDSTTTQQIVVYIANVFSTISVNSSTRLRSGGNNGTSPQNHVITIQSNQNLISDPSINASVGTWQGGGFTGATTTWTRSLQIHDNDTKGIASFSNLSATNLAGKVQTTINSGASYTVGGFVIRTLTIAAWPNREASIGTQISDTSKLECSNLSEGPSGSLNYTFKTSIVNEKDKFTITQPTGVYNSSGNIWYNCDLANAVSNTSGTAQVELEETI